MCDPTLQDPRDKIIPGMWTSQNVGLTVSALKFKYFLVYYDHVIAVSFIGMDPYIQYNKDSQVIGGAELDIIDTYAKAYGFMPKLRREPTYDSSSWDPRGEGEIYVRGPVHKESFTNSLIWNDNIIFFIFLHNRLQVIGMPQMILSSGEWWDR